MGILEVANGCQKLPYAGESHLFVVSRVIASHGSHADYVHIS